MDLLPSQKTSIHDVIVRAGLDPAAFVWETHANPSRGVVSPQLLHRSSGYFFRFLETPVGHSFRFSPDDEKIVTERGVDNWQMVLSHLRSWLSNVRRETSVSDPWSTVQNVMSVPEESVSSDSNARFAPAELHVVHSQMDSLVAEIERLEIGTGAEREAIQKSLSELRDAAERLGRKDWQLLFLGTMTSLVLGHIVSSDTMKTVWHLAAGIFHNISRLLAAGQ